MSMSGDVGNPARLARLLAGHEVGLYGYVFACVRNHEDTRRILQAVAQAMAQERSSPTSDHGFLGWARQIARAKMVAMTPVDGTLRPLDPVLVQQLSDAANRVDALRNPAEYQGALLSCVEQLPPRSRLLLALWYDDSVRSVEALAKRLGCDEPAAAAMLRQVKTIVRDCVERRATARFEHGITRAQ
jgi:DNA-directed RNA polymerase specialized sigma24 family protein